MPATTTSASSLLWMIESGVIVLYEIVIWIPAEKSDNSKDTLCFPDFSGNSEIGLVAEDWSTRSEIKNDLAVFWIEELLARYGRPCPDLDSPLPLGIIAVRVLLLQQIFAMQANACEMEPEDQGFRQTCDMTMRAILGALAEEGGFNRGKFGKILNHSPVRSQISPKVIAFYLPQFHPISENDHWWGHGFTEWHNVAKSTPLFHNHYQPRLPADIGFYDLRLIENQEAQAAMAKQYGIHGFCYYYYWFNGKKLLQKPLEQMIMSGRPDFPFCVCWANENWTRNWDGQKDDTLIAQTYSHESNLELILELIELMKDSRYIRYNGKPVLMIYRLTLIPKSKKMFTMWREECRKAGLDEIHLCAVRFKNENLLMSPEEYGLDAFVIFPPHDMLRSDALESVSQLNPNFQGKIYSYDAMLTKDLQRFENGYSGAVHRGATMGWDNTPRRKMKAQIFTGCSPMRYRYWLKSIIDQEHRYRQGEESLIFINAWNEWAEGTFLEPDQRYGKSYLEATLSALKSYNRK
jgi:hypothetical protein